MQTTVKRQSLSTQGGKSTKYIPFEVSFFLWLAMTVEGDAGGPVGSTGAVGVTVVAEASITDGGGDSEDGVPELDILGYAEM